MSKIVVLASSTKFRRTSASTLLSSKLRFVVAAEGFTVATVLYTYTVSTGALLDLIMLLSISTLLLLLLVPAASAAFGPLPVNHQQGPPSTSLVTAPWGVSGEARTKRPSFSYSSVDDLVRRRPVCIERFQEQQQQQQPLSRLQSLLSASSAIASDVNDLPPRPVRIIISGAPASGKGTQCEKIKERYGVVHLSTGDILRAAVAARTEVGLQAKEYMDSGRLVPDDVITGVVRG
jgi:hypothetical protein